MGVFYIFVVQRNQETVTKHIFVDLILSGVNTVTSTVNIVYACKKYFPVEKRFNISSGCLIEATAWCPVTFPH